MVRDVHKRVCVVVRSLKRQGLLVIFAVEGACPFEEANFGEGGAGKAPEVATQAYQEKSEDISDFMKRSFGDNVDKIFVCAGAGGGTGAGSVVPAVRSAVEAQASSGSSKKVGVILALPKASEGKRVNANAANTLNQVYDLVEQDIVSPLILIDNEKIGELYPNLVVSEFWTTPQRKTRA